MGSYVSKGGSCTNCPKKIRSLITQGHNLDNTALLTLKIVFYVLSITMITFMIYRQIAMHRDAKKKSAMMMKEGCEYSDGVVDLERAALF